MTGLLNDLRQALRSLRRTPAFTVAAVLTLGLGIGVTGAVYSVGNGLLWRPLPAPGAERLTVLYASRDNEDYEDLSWPDYEDLRQATGSVFDGLIAYTAQPLSLSHGGQSERVYGELVSDNYFSLLGGSPALGRTFSAADAEPGSAPAVVLSDGFWRARFQADPAVLRQTVKLNGQLFTVIGVAPRTFRSPFYVGFAPALWVRAAAHPLLQPGQGDALHLRGEVSFRMMGRLREGVSLAAARAAVIAVVDRLAPEYPATRRGFTGALFAERDARPEPMMARGMHLAFRLFLAIGGGVLLIACANVASLLLARAIARRREIAVRLALGAGRGRLIQQLLTESLVLALAGGAVGLLISAWMGVGVTRLLRFSTDIPFVFDLSTDHRVVWFTLGLTVLTTFLFGLVPAVQASSPELQGALKGDAARGGRSSRLFAFLVAAQVALSCLLLVGAGLVVRTLGAMRDVAPGFQTSHRLLVSVSPGLQGYDAEHGGEVYRRLLERLADVPGVASVTIADDVPLDFTSNSSQVVADGVDTRGKGGEPLGLTVVGPAYFATMGTALEEGRVFVPGDSLGAQRVAVVSRAMAERLWPSLSALGRVFRFGGADGEAITVVGIAADAKYRQLSEFPQPHAYFPLAQHYPGSVTLVIQTQNDPIAMAAPVRAAITAVDPDLPIAAVRSYDELLAGRALLLPGVAARITGAMGALALLLSLIGLYGVVSYGVAQRRRELGIRLALGATNGTVVRMMLGDGVRLAAFGIGAGMVASLLVTRLARALLFGVSPTDPLVLAGVVLVLGSVTLLASWIPARRAARVDPIGVLRGE